jgi:hypothetical protein
VDLMSAATTISSAPGRRRWLVVSVLGVAQLMMVPYAMVLSPFLYSRADLW